MEGCTNQVQPGHINCTACEQAVLRSMHEIDKSKKAPSKLTPYGGRHIGAPSAKTMYGM